MPLGHQAHEPVGQQRPYDQVVPFLRARGALVAEGERHVAVARAQQLDRAGRFGLLQGDPGAGVGGAQRGEGGRDQGGAAAGEGDQADPARAQPGDGGDLLLGRGEPGEDAPGVPHQRLTGLGEPHLAAGAHQQRGADRALQGLHLLADGGLGAAQFAGRGGEGSAGGDGAQDAQMAGLDHPSSIRQPWAYRRKTRRHFDRGSLTVGA
ncbi:hypothetical protein CF54_01460 [Streptomyces sp. Tu 6176]|nr:hypothetical protein CF54_01460 [Streptomyces sp. Tu 6176]